MPLDLSVALLADPHYHDISRGRPLASVRSLGDALSASRVVNESYFSLPAALDDVVRRGLKVAVIAGDLTEDGQRGDIEALMALLSRYRAAHGLMFFATFGNHDTYGLSGRYQIKSFLNDDGQTTLSTSDAAHWGGAMYDAAMHTDGYAETLGKMCDLGFFSQPHFHHWETPFGSSDALSQRTYPARSSDGKNVIDLIDASYLVEPAEGLWLLSLDSNVYLPNDGPIDPKSETAFLDSKDGKWDDVVTHRPYLVEWIRDVRQRADRLGKTLVAFSHYAIAAPEWERAWEGQFSGGSILTKVGASAATIQTMEASGLGVHFSGHSHVATVTEIANDAGTLVDIAIPALCSFPPGYRLVHVRDGLLATEIISVRKTAPLSPLIDLYRRQAERDPAIALGLHDILESSDFGRFIDSHLAAAVKNELAKKHFGAALAGFAGQGTLQQTLADLADGAIPPKMENTGGDIALIDVIVDWYRLWRGGDVALGSISAERIENYRQVAALTETLPEPTDPTLRDVLHLIRKLGSLVRSPLKTAFSSGRNVLVSPEIPSPPSAVIP